MKLEPTNWSVVLVGRWDPAILSPSGIAKHVFHLAPKTQVQVAVPLDGVSAYLVTNLDSTLTVHVERDRLQIDVLRFDYQSLAQGLLAGVNALEALPMTPFSAVGYNINFTTNELCPELISLTDCPVDKDISEKGYTLSGRSLGRSVQYGDGQINISIGQKDNSYAVNCNFHLDVRSVEKAKAWLSTSVELIKQEISKIAAFLKVELEEMSSD